MTYEEMVSIIKQANENADATAIREHVAIEVDVRGEAEGAFYIEIREGKVLVEPYEYYDRDAIITASAQVAIDVTTGKLGIEEAYNEGRLHIRGKFDKAYLLDEISYKKKAVKSKRSK